MILSDKIEEAARELMPAMRQAMVAGSAWQYSHETVDKRMLTLLVDNYGYSWVSETYLPNTTPHLEIPVLNYRNDQAAIQRAAYIIAALSTVA